MNEEYISVSQFAKLANVSRQTVYNALQSRLTEFVKVDCQGRKVISTKALEVFAPPPNLSNLTEVDSQETVKDSQKLDNLTERLTEILQAQIEQLKEETLYLRQELEKKDSIIKEKDIQIAETTTAFARLAEQAQTLATQAQTLHAADKPQLLETIAEAETPQDIVADSAPHKKKGFLSRLFNH